MQKTYKFEKCTFKKLLDVMSNNNSILYNKIEWIPGLNKCYKFLIYKNDIVIGYICFLDFKKFTNYIINIANPNLNYDIYFNNILNYFNNQKLLYISAFEIFNQYKSFNTLKNVFNMIKKYAFNKFQYILCYADSKIISRLYKICGFIELNKFDFPEEIPEEDGANILMYLDINQKDYYEVNEKLKNKYKKNLLFENMKNTKKLYETIMTSVAKQVKKAINEGEYRNDYSSREEYEDEGMDVQGDTEAWVDGVKEFLNSNINSDHTLPLLATVIAWNELSDEEIRGLAESIMLYVEKYSDFGLPPFDEVFIEPVTEVLFNNGIIDDWMADVVNENRIDAYNI